MGLDTIVDKGIKDKDKNLIQGWNKTNWEVIMLCSNSSNVVHNQIMPLISGPVKDLMHKKKIKIQHNF